MYMVSSKVDILRAFLGQKRIEKASGFSPSDEEEKGKM
jgi:hypothetical protein